MSWVGQEREALEATLRSSDPDALTLCEGWNVRRLLAHLTQREQYPLARIVDVGSRKPPGHEPGLSRLVSRSATPEGYDALVDLFTRGAPWWSPLSWAADKLNLLEYVIHHEDIRRAGTDPAPPRDLPPAQQQAVWQNLGLFAKLQFRRSPVGVRLATPEGQSRLVKAGDLVTLTGEPVELALWITGRRALAQVTVSGAPEATSSFYAWTATG